MALSLKCPLCCQTLFDDALALRDHMNNEMYKLLECPNNCGYFGKFQDMICHLEELHLSKKCPESKTYIQHSSESKKSDKLENLDHIYVKSEIIVQDSVMETDLSVQFNRQLSLSKKKLATKQCFNNNENDSPDLNISAGAHESNTFASDIEECSGVESSSNQQNDNSPTLNPSYTHKKFDHDDHRKITNTYQSLVVKRFNQLGLHGDEQVNLVKKEVESTPLQTDSVSSIPLKSMPNPNKNVSKKGYQYRESRWKGPIKGWRTSYFQDKFRCRHCREVFGSETRLSTHLKTHRPPRIFQCTVCPYNCTSPREFRTHKYTAHNENENEKKETVITCNQCGKTFAKNYNLDRHMKRKHNPDLTELCTYCDKYFAHKDDLHSHLVIHLNQNSLTCRKCHVVFSSKSSLQRHIKSAHLNKERFYCDECGMSFKRHDILLDHIKLKHDPVKPFQCKNCDVKFSSMRHLSSHVIKHDSEKKYECKICHKFFKHMSSRYKHMVEHKKKKESIHVPEDALIIVD